jgi:Cu(I)/Ag(I) efflux system membrane protein CusA/SilA
MIAALIRWSVLNRFLVLIATAFLIAAGVWSVTRTPLDALPDLSDTQVIVRTPFPGKAPQIVEDLVTYPMTTTMLSVPGAKTVRGYSFFGDSFVYVLFDDKTDPYWARSRVVEYLNQVQSRLPPGASASLGPDATGVGWVYEYALVDRSGTQDLSQLRALNDWFLRFELKTVPDVAEVASIGGMVRQYQVVLDPDRMRTLAITQATVVDALQKANQATGGSVVELADAEYMVRSRGYLRSLDDFRSIPLSVTNATPVLLRDVATVQLGPEPRRGIAELDGEGEVAGGVVVMRSGKNALTTIEAVKARLESLKSSLPPGVEIVSTYDRSQLIDRAVDHLRSKLVEEFIVVALVCAIFLFHLRSALVAVVALPIGVLAAFVVMRWQGVNANIMSLGGIAIAIGAMVDASIVMVENVHKHIEAFEARHRRRPSASEHWTLVSESATEVGPCTLLLVDRHHPVVRPRVHAGGAGRASVLAPGVHQDLCDGGRSRVVRHACPGSHGLPHSRPDSARDREPAQPLPDGDLPAGAGGRSALSEAHARHRGRRPRSDRHSDAAARRRVHAPLGRGRPPVHAVCTPGLSASKAAQLLQQTDRMIKTVPEVARVFGKAGRADTATDPAPLEMFETTIQFKPRSEWRPGMTPDKLVEELDAAVKVPGLSNIWVPPIRNRIDMLATGIKSPVGIKVAGADLATIDKLTTQIESAVKSVPGVSSALAERLTGGRYIDVEVDRAAAARFGLSVADVQAVVSTAIGGDNVGEVIQGRERYPINVRYPREIRDSLQGLRELPFVTGKGAQLLLQDVARVSIDEGPPDASQRERAPFGLDLRRRARPGPPLGRERHAGRGQPAREAAAGIRGLLVGTVRVPRTGDRAAQARRARDAGRHLRPALRPFSLVQRRCARHGRRAVRARGGLLARLGAGTLPVRGFGSRLHRAGGNCRRVRGGHARVPEERTRPATRRRRAGRRGDAAGCDPRGRGASRPSQGNDGRRRHRRAAADHVGERHRFRGDEPDRRPDGRRHGYRAPAEHARRAGRVVSAAPPAR